MRSDRVNICVYIIIIRTFVHILANVLTCNMYTHERRRSRTNSHTHTLLKSLIMTLLYVYYISIIPLLYFYCGMLLKLTLFWKLNVAVMQQ